MPIKNILFRKVACSTNETRCRFKAKVLLVGALLVWESSLLITQAKAQNVCGLRIVTFDNPIARIDRSKVAAQRESGVGPRVLLGDHLEPLSTAITAAPWELSIAPDFYKTGCCSIRMVISPESQLNQPSKIELNVVRGDKESSGGLLLHDGEPHVLSFAFKENEAYQNPTSWALHFQVWQRSPLQPPLAMVAIPSSGADERFTKYMIIVRTDKYKDKKTWDNGKILEFEDGNSQFTLEKGKWYKFTFVLSPHPTGSMASANGIIEMWIDSKKVLDYKGDWGFSHLPNDTLGYFVKLGIYRASQLRTQDVLFDDLIWGSWTGCLDSNKVLPYNLELP